MRRDPLELFTRLAREYGDMVQLRLGDHEHDLYLVNHPDLIKQVLVTNDSRFVKWFAVERIKEVLGNGLFVSEGEFHLRQRRLSQPAFHRECVAGYARDMVQHALTLCGRWRAGEELDVSREMNWLAMMIVGSTLFGADLDADAAAVRDSLGEILDQFERSMLPHADREDFERALKQLDDAVYRIVQARRAKDQDHGDLLSILLRAHETEGEEARMSDLQLRDEAMTIFLAGHETSANALAFTWYLLSQNPEIETRFHDEIDNVLQGRTPTVADVPQLPLTGRIFSETLRLYPPLWAIGRQATQPVRIGEHSLRTGSVVILSQWVTHRDPRWYPEPQRFDPERWLPEQRAERPRFSYFPFSAGSRACLGEAFAGIEGVLCLATIAQKWRFLLERETTVALQPQLTLRARRGIRMRIAPRN
jgi:cytochrome P450